MLRSGSGSGGNPSAGLVEARARCAAASPPARRSQELVGGGCRPVPEPKPASPRLMAGLSNSASAGPIGCTSGRWALDLGFLPGFFGVGGFFAMGRIWDGSAAQKRGNAMKGFAGAVLFVVCTLACQQVSAQGNDAEPATRAANEVFAKTLPFADRADFDDAQRGFIATLPDGVVAGPGGRPAFDAKRYAFLSKDA